VVEDTTRWAQEPPASASASASSLTVPTTEL